MLSLVRIVRKMNVGKRWHSDTIGPYKRHHLMGAADANALIKPALKHLKRITVIAQQDVNLKVSHSINKIIDDTYIIDLALNANSDVVKPAIYVCCLDISSSMDGSSAYDNTDPECSEFTRWDLVKYSINTIIHCLRPVDKLAIVSFNDDAKNVMQLTNMNEHGKKSAIKSLNKVNIGGDTNLWAGLNMSMDIINNVPNDIDTNAFLLVLTGGEPNRNPPKGIIEEFVQKNLTTKMPATVHVFGYGYGLDSTLLSNLSDHGAGLFAHIPDHIMCNTVFINYLSNTLATSVNKVTVKVDTGTNYRDLTILSQPVNRKSLDVSIGSIQSGQSRNLMWKVVLNRPNDFKLNLNIEYGNKVIPYQITNGNTLSNNTLNYDSAKLKLLDIIRTGLTNYDLDKTCVELDQLCMGINRRIEESNNSSEKEKFKALLTNVKSVEKTEGQIYKAFSKLGDGWYTERGFHYLRYFIRSHETQLCSNSKDASLQKYGGQLFREIKTEVEDIFDNVLIPQPSRSTKRFQGNYTQNFYSPSGPCFDGYGYVKMADSSSKQVKDLVKGDKIINSNWNMATIVCVIKMKIKNGVTNMLLVNGMKIILYYPMRHNGKWEHPINVGKLELTVCDYVYNLVLDNYHMVTINDIDVITLGHGIKDGSIVEHPLFGTNKVIDHLKNHPGWKDGLIELDDYNPKHENGLISPVC